MNIEEREVTKTVAYATIGGEEVRAAKLLDFLQEIEGTDTMFPMRWNGTYDDIAEALREVDVVGRTNRGSWYLKDDEKREEMVHELWAHFHDE